MPKQFDKEWLLNKNKKSIFNYGYSYPEAEKVNEDIINLVKAELKLMEIKKTSFEFSDLPKYGKKISYLFIDSELDRWKNLLTVLETQANEIKMSEILEDEARFNC